MNGKVYDLRLDITNEEGLTKHMFLSQHSIAGCYMPDRNEEEYDFDLVKSMFERFVEYYYITGRHEPFEHKLERGSDKYQSVFAENVVLNQGLDNLTKLWQDKTNECEELKKRLKELEDLKR